MSEKKRDDKNRVLKKGERQRSDGRYEYRSKDAYGHPVSVYSWRLVETDRVSAGFEKEPALRSLEEKLKKEINVSLDITARNSITLNECYD